MGLDVFLSLLCIGFFFCNGNFSTCVNKMLIIFLIIIFLSSKLVKDGSL
jgi:hypothetical protein